MAGDIINVGQTGPFGGTDYLAQIWQMLVDARTGTFPLSMSGGVGGGSGITALTGDVTASGTGSVAATVARVAGMTISGSPAAGSALYNNGGILAGFTGFTITTGALATITASGQIQGSTLRCDGTNTDFLNAPTNANGPGIRIFNFSATTFIATGNGDGLIGGNSAGVMIGNGGTVNFVGLSVTTAVTPQTGYVLFSVNGTPTKFLTGT